jgi:hypothetical protein
LRPSWPIVGKPQKSRDRTQAARLPGKKVVHAPLTAISVRASRMITTLRETIMSRMSVAQRLIPVRRPAQSGAPVYPPLRLRYGFACKGQGREAAR